MHCNPFNGNKPLRGRKTKPKNKGHITMAARTKRRPSTVDNGTKPAAFSAGARTQGLEGMTQARHGINQHGWAKTSAGALGAGGAEPGDGRCGASQTGASRMRASAQPPPLAGSTSSDPSWLEWRGGGGGRAASRQSGGTTNHHGDSVHVHLAGGICMRRGTTCLAQQQQSSKQHTQPSSPRQLGASLPGRRTCRPAGPPPQR